MKAIRFDQANKTLTAPPGQEAEVYDLPVWSDGERCISCWQPTEEERAAIAAGAPVWLWVMGLTHPPVAVEVLSPFAASFNPLEGTNESPPVDLPSPEERSTPPCGGWGCDARPPDPRLLVPGRRWRGDPALPDPRPAGGGGMSAVPVVHLVEDGHLAFRCPGCKGPHVLDVRSRWQWNGDSIKPTLSPSVLVRSGHHVPGHRPGVDNCWCTYQKEHPEDPVPFSCAVCHSFVRSGEVEFLGDSTHALAGQTVPLPPWEEAT